MELRNKIIEAVLASAPSLSLENAENIADRILHRLQNDPEAYTNLEEDIRTFLFELENQKEKERKQLQAEFDAMDLDDALSKLKAKVQTATTQNPQSNENTAQKAKEAAQKHIAELEKLAQLKEKGIINDEELQELKRKLEF